MENPSKKFFRLSIGKEVRLLHAYYIKCEKIIKNNSGEIKELHCTYDPQSYGGWSKDGRKVKGTLHWVSVKHALNGTINFYDKLFKNENPMDFDKDFTQNLNTESITIHKNAKFEINLKNACPNNKYQFVRKGYFTCDKTSNNKNLIFNQIVGLRDNWSKKNL